MDTLQALLKISVNSQYYRMPYIENTSFSIVTPTWNRAGLLPRVHKSLTEQTYKNFEWIVADDGSSDDTKEVIYSLASNSSFPIRYIHFDLHVGKPTVDNAAIVLARGVLTLWCDSDDWLLPNALEEFWMAWNSIPEIHQIDYSGITALVATKEGCITNPVPEAGWHDISWNDLSEKFHVTRDMVFCAQTHLLKANPFPEVDLVVPESSVWVELGFRPARLFSKVLKMTEYLVHDGISLAQVMNYNRGRAHSLAITTNKLQVYNPPLQLRLRRLVKFIRYSLHGEITLSDARALWRNNSSSLSYLLMFPFGLLLALKDCIQGKVRYSHREFVANRGRACMTIKSFPSSC